MPNSTEVKINQLIGDLGHLILSGVEKKLTTPASEQAANTDSSAWVSAFLDARWYADAEGWKAKCRIVLPNSGLKSLRTSDAMDDIIRSLTELRKEITINLWYGLKINVTPDGSIRAEFNEDPNCVVDPQWWG